MLDLGYWLVIENDCEFINGLVWNVWFQVKKKINMINSNLDIYIN